jgi:hypothetical protein
MRNAGPILILLLLLGLAALAFFGLSRDDDYDHSPLGSKGLQVWLQAKGISVLRSDAHIGRARTEISSRILFLPISQGGTAAPAGEETENQGPQGWVREAQRYGLPTLILVPKWSGSVLRQGIARQSDLVALNEIEAELGKIEPSNLRLNRHGPGFEEANPSLQAGQPIAIALYQAQTFDRASLPRICKELAGTQSGALLIRCEDNPVVYLLSDPDLLNNHGLAQADNAAFALSLIRYLRGATEIRPVYLDTAGRPLDTESPDRQKSEDEGRTYERSSSDLQRFFAYPLSVIWGTLFAVAAICFWRGAYRFGPPLSEASANIELSRTAAIEATARLLRLSGNDGRMAAQFVQHQLADKAQLIFGSGAGNEAGVERMFQRFVRRDHEKAQALQLAARALIDQGHVMTRSDLHRNLETFRTLLGSIELGTR